MKAWMLYAQKDSIKNRIFIKMFMDEARQRGIELSLVFVEDLYENACQDVPELVISRMRDYKLAKKLEAMGACVHNPSKTIEIGNDKGKTYRYLSERGIKCVPTEIYNANEWKTIITNSSSPLVVKSVSGHGGSQVFLTTQSSITTIEHGIGDDCVVVQPYMNYFNRDVRVYVLGNRILAAVERSCNNDFRSNFSLGGQVRLIELNETQINVTHHVMENFDFSLAGIDFLCNEKGEFLLNEIEDCVGSRMLFSVSKIPLISMYYDYVMK